MAYEVVMSYHLHMPSYFLGTFTEYPYLAAESPGVLRQKTGRFLQKTGSFARKVREFYPESPGLLRGKLRSFEQPLPFSIKFPLYL